MSPHHFGRLLWTELKLVVREPIVLIFVFAFPIFTVLVLGGIFDGDDPAFEGANPAHWYVAAYVGVVVAAIGLIMLPVHIAGYRERGVLRRFEVSFFPRWALPAAHLVTGLVLTVVGTATLLAVAAVAYEIPEMEDPAVTLTAMALAALCFMSIGVALGWLLPSARSAQGLGLLAFFPSFLLGGAGPPPNAMGDTMEAISQWIPLTHAIRAIQEPWLDLGQPTLHLAVLSAITLVSSALALRLGRARH